MGCFLACFGSKNDGKRRNQRRQVQPRDLKNPISHPVQSSFPSISGVSDEHISPVTEAWDKPQEQVSLRTRKKVTFDSNVKTYEHVLANEEADLLRASGESRKKEEENLAKLGQAKSSSEDSVVSSLSSYPPNHRYSNCRESDDEDEELDYADSYHNDGDDDEFSDLSDDEDGIRESRDGIRESRDAIPTEKEFTEEVDSFISVCGLPEKEGKPLALNRNARDRSNYVHSVLNPVENLSQWKAVKGRGTPPPLKPLKENLTLNQDPSMSYNSQQGFKELPFSFKSKTEQPKNLKQEMPVDASLSNWLVSSEATPVNQTTNALPGTFTPEGSMSQVSNSLRSQEERPILGALTVEELKQFSATSSPRKSPSRSPDEMAIIGTVGTYWSHTAPSKDSGSASSFKGIPNTTSKYREDNKVNWHSTPFETRLERALNRGAAEA